MKKILAIPGSIRKKSYNKALSRYLEKQSDTEYQIVRYELDSIPFFNEDLEENLPEEIQHFIESVEKADAIILITPEYSNMVPGVLKNALEWLTRKYSSQAVKDKPVAIMGVSTGGFGTVRAQNELLLIAGIMKFKIDGSFRLPISYGNQIFDESGELIDQNIQEKVKDFLNKFKLSLQ